MNSKPFNLKAPIDDKAYQRALKEARYTDMARKQFLIMLGTILVFGVFGTFFLSNTANTQDSLYISVTQPYVSWTSFMIAIIAWLSMMLTGYAWPKSGVALTPASRQDIETLMNWAQETKGLAEYFKPFRDEQLSRPFTVKESEMWLTEVFDQLVKSKMR